MIVAEKKEWIEKYDHHPPDYWQKRWNFLCHRLNQYADMERQLRQSETRYVRLEEKEKIVEN